MNTIILPPHIPKSREPEPIERAEIGALEYSTDEEEREHFRAGAQYMIDDAEGRSIPLGAGLVLLGGLISVMMFLIGAFLAWDDRPAAFNRPGDVLLLPYEAGKVVGKFLWERPE